MQNRQSEEIRVTTKTVDAAIKEAASSLGVDIADVEHRVVSQTNGGFTPRELAASLIAASTVFAVTRISSDCLFCI